MPVILENVPLAPYTTFKVGGAARFFCVAASEGELREALEYARERQIQTFILGGGSNVLVSDEGFQGLVIKLETKGVSYEIGLDSGVLVTASAGEAWDGLVAETVERGYWGLENLSAIPGTVGAAAAGNIGAYGVEVKDVIESVAAIHRDTLETRAFSSAECRFAYRDSFFKSKEGSRYIILSVAFRLSSVPRPNLSYKDLAERFAGQTSFSASHQADIRKAVIDIRAAKFPDYLPESPIGTAGSFWKNPVIDAARFRELKARYPDLPSFPVQEGKVKVPLAYILDKVCGLKGYARGHVGLFKNQPLVLVAEKGATAAEIDVFAENIASLILEKTEIEIAREVGSF
ncbi:MAG TPA: UDP-N-acetylmuramate dehydrogenase [Candidatus Paceibacterota bacterium]|nr:UDP-N-acetylmuramate dehydrogenase [Candidatus Paceibacterota bacterium]